METPIFDHTDEYDDKVEIASEDDYSYMAFDGISQRNHTGNKRIVVVISNRGVYIPLARIPELITALATSYRELTGEFPLAPKPDTEQENT